MLILQYPHDAKPDPTRPSRSKFSWKITTNRTVEDRHLNLWSCMGRSCAAHDKPMENYFYRRFSRFWCIFVAENSAAEDLAKNKMVKCCPWVGFEPGMSNFKNLNYRANTWTSEPSLLLEITVFLCIPYQWCMFRRCISVIIIFVFQISGCQTAPWFTMCALSPP